jgi:hypothetical protein
MSKKQINLSLVILYFSVSLIEIFAEFINNSKAILYTKPLVMPILIVMYLLVSVQKNYIFITALIFNWIANIFFVNTDVQSALFGSLFFLVYRILIIFMVLKMVKLPSLLPMIIGSLPFLSIFIFITKMAYDEFGNGLYVFLTQGIFISFLGGICLGNFILKPNKCNTLLLISTMLFTFAQFSFVLRLYYTNLNIFQPTAMLFFVLGQFMLYKCVVNFEIKTNKNLN